MYAYILDIIAKVNNFLDDEKHSSYVLLTSTFVQKTYPQLCKKVAQQLKPVTTP